MQLHRITNMHNNNNNNGSNNVKWPQILMAITISAWHNNDIFLYWLVGFCFEWREKWIMFESWCRRWLLFGSKPIFKSILFQPDWFQTFTLNRIHRGKKNDFRKEKKFFFSLTLEKKLLKKHSHTVLFFQCLLLSFPFRRFVRVHVCILIHTTILIIAFSCLVFVVFFLLYIFLSYIFFGRIQLRGKERTVFKSLRTIRIRL